MKITHGLGMAAAVALLAATPALAQEKKAAPAAPAASTQQTQTAQGSEMSNPFFQEWKTPFGAPPFDKIRTEHYLPAFQKGFEEQKAAVLAIAGSKEAPTFANTIEALERSGRTLDRVENVFGHQTGSNSDEALEAVQREVSPLQARHASEIFLNPDLFKRVEALYQQRETLKLTPEQKRLLERYHLLFVRSGAKLDEAGKKRFAEINQRLATLSTTFTQNQLKDERAYQLVLETKEDLAGLPDFVVKAAAKAAEERNLPGKHVITLSRSSVEPFLTFSERRDLREKAFKAWASRGDMPGATDNKPVIKEILALRHERSKLLGYETYADFKLDDTMAKNPAAVRKLLEEVWKPAVARAGEERDQLQAMAKSEGKNFAIEPWDWRHYSEKVRKAQYDLDSAEVKQYFELNRMIEAAFHTANQLYGLTFTERKDVPVYNPDVRVWEVKDAAGKHVGLFYGDYFASKKKRSGAWMNSLRVQERFDGAVTPLITNNLNYAKGEPTLLSYDDAETLFHEFGHALHGLLSNVSYPLIAGTAVLRDFVELPAQIKEHWLAQPEIMQKFALHYQTGKPMPKELLDKVVAARNFNQGFATVEYLASSFVDMELHQQKDFSKLDVAQFEKDTLAKIGMPKEIIMRHRTPHFGHVFAGEGYSAGYYSYMWAEVLDTDGFQAFKEAGSIFDKATAKKLQDNIYSVGNSRDPMEAYIAFRGRAPTTEALLRNRGFLPATN
ncbi:MAG TPA: M3 family metallopeptidase [Azospirillaceae bacterium]|nr:M3 family metallopeptidase [Azospirillaceae bacterium]